MPWEIRWPPWNAGDLRVPVGTGDQRRRMMVSGCKSIAGVDNHHWLVVTGCHEFWIFPDILGIDVIIPIDELHHFSEGWRKTTNQITVSSILWGLWIGHYSASQVPKPPKSKVKSSWSLSPIASSFFLFALFLLFTIVYHSTYFCHYYCCSSWYYHDHDHFQHTIVIVFLMIITMTIMTIIFICSHYQA